MGYVYRRGKQWGIAFEGKDGREVRRIVGRSKAEAEATLHDVEALIQEMPEARADFREVAELWFQRRQRRRRSGLTNDRSYLTHHILPYFGEMDADKIKVRDVRAFVAGLEEKGLAPRSVRNVYGTLRKLFNDLVVDEIVGSTPCVLGKDHLPKNEDVDPEWRVGAVFSREEVRQLLTAELLDDSRTINLEARRMLYAIAYFTGCRIGEVLVLRWRHITPAPHLQKLVVARSLSGRTKTGVTRQVPVHPELARRLARWKATGWGEYQGRAPNEEDLVLPSRKGVFFHKSSALHRLHRDLGCLGLRERRLHDFRRSFISHALEGGARRDVLKRITHTSTKDMIDLYTSVSWEEMCKAVLCLELGLKEADEAVEGEDAPAREATEVGEATEGGDATEGEGAPIPVEEAQPEVERAPREPRRKVIRRPRKS